MNRARLLETIARAEGYRREAYWDRRQWTYGYGCRAPGRDAVIEEPDARGLLEQRVDEAIADFYRLFSGAAAPINEAREEAFAEMIYQLGRAGVGRFRMMCLDALDDDPDDWPEVARHARESQWRTQTPARAERICRQLETGTIQEG